LPFGLPAFDVPTENLLAMELNPRSLKTALESLPSEKLKKLFQSFKLWNSFLF
jgi:hypothetical protein